MNVQVIGVWWWVFGSFKVTPEVFSWVSTDQSSSSTLTESSFLFDSSLIHRSVGDLLTKRKLNNTDATSHFHNDKCNLPSSVQFNVRICSDSDNVFFGHANKILYIMCGQILSLLPHTLSSMWCLLLATTTAEISCAKWFKICFFGDLNNGANTSNMMSDFLNVFSVIICYLVNPVSRLNRVSKTVQTRSN